METQKIEYLVVTEVPKGKACWEVVTSYTYNGNIKITTERTVIEKCEKLIDFECSLFPMTPRNPGEMSVGCSVSQGSNKDGSDVLEVFKCPACLEACANGFSDAVGEIQNV